MLLSEYRLARGLSTAQVAERVGISRNAAAQLDRHDGAWRALNFEQLTSLAATYGVDLGDLIHRLTSRRPGYPLSSDDATKLEAALSHAGQVRRDDIAIALGWTLERTEAAFSTLADKLRTRGQALARPGPETYRLITRPDILNVDQIQKLTGARLSKGAGPTLAQANVVRVLADQPGNRGSRALFTDPDEHQAITELLAAGTLGEWEDTLAISADAAFSLYERYRPSSILTAMSQSDDAHGSHRSDVSGPF